MISAADVETIHRAMSDAGLQYWITGGWGIDALLGNQTRQHHDLDISIPAKSLDTVLHLLKSMGYRAKTDWLPTRIALCDSSGREVDVHPIVLEDDGSAWLPGLDGTRFVYPRDSFGRGMVGDCEVPCISAELQIAFHSGYPPQPKDLADIAALRSAGLVAEAAAQADVDASD